MGQVAATPPSGTTVTSIICMTVISIIRTRVTSTST
jgi:hypothetical protein